MYDLTAGGWISIPLAFLIVGTLLAVNLFRTPLRRSRGKYGRRPKQNKTKGKE
jgi:hypothetical protein